MSHELVNSNLLFDYLNTGIFTDRIMPKFEKNTYSLGNQISEMSDISKLGKEIVVLEGRYCKVLIVRYPYRSRIILVRLSFKFYFILGLIGLLRRIILGTKRLNSSIIVRSVKYYRELGGFYLELENQNSLVPTQFSLCEKIGYRGFLDYLNSLKKDYVVIRFFEKLPEIRRAGGDLDIVVDDEILTKAIDYLRLNPGNLLVDLYGVTTPANGAMLPYYPPWFMRDLFKNKLLHSSGYYVPSNFYYLLSFVYHCIYHKGYSSGITSELFNHVSYKDPDNDYENYLIELFKMNKVYCPEKLTLEWLDCFLENNRIKPHSDTLSFIALTNSWLAKYLEHKKIKTEIGISILILKEGVINELNSVSQYIESRGFTILYNSILDDDKYKVVIDRLRGGNWFSNGCDKILFNPKYIMVLADLSDFSKYCIKKRLYTPRIRSLKNKLRLKFDKYNESFFHATDNSLQTSEYILELFNENYFKNIKSTIENDVQIFCKKKIFPWYFTFKISYKQFIYLAIKFNKFIISYIRRFV